MWKRTLPKKNDSIKHKINGWGPTMAGDRWAVVYAELKQQPQEGKVAGERDQWEQLGKSRRKELKKKRVCPPARKMSKRKFAKKKNRSRAL